MPSDLPRPFPLTSGEVEIFDEFFSSGMEESVSPFITPTSRHFGKNLPLKAAILSAILLFFSYFFAFFPSTLPLSNIALLFTFFFAGIPALIASIEDIVDLQINIDVLMTLAAFLSVIIGSGREGGLLLVLFAISGAMEEAVRSKAKGAIHALKKVAPTKAYVVDTAGQIHERSVKDIKVGTQIHIPAGEIVPLDGVVIQGSTSINLVHLTGENLPVVKGVGEEVVAGARNLEGAITLRVTKTSADSTLTQILNLILQAQAAKPKLERWLDKISRGYATTIIAIACAVALFLPWITAIPLLGVSGSVYRGLTFLIAASPCALIIAVPIAYLSAVSVCAKKGILLKGGVVLDALTSCRKVAFDKTGTLTQGELQLIEIKGSGDMAEALSVAIALERNVIHPIATALLEEGKKRNLQIVDIQDFKYHAGLGLEGRYQNAPVYLGNAAYIGAYAPLEGEKYTDTTVTFLFLKGQLFVFRFKDHLRSKVPSVLANLKRKWGLTLVMLTGDHEASAHAMAREAGIEEVHANLRPEQKLTLIDTFAKKENIAMVGDGINDAPSLARATVGISMGKRGSATAVDASDIVLLNDNIEHLEWLWGKAFTTRRIVRQNLSFAAAAIIFATLPALMGWVPLWGAVLLHEGGTVAVGLNALRLLRK